MKIDIFGKRADLNTLSKHWLEQHCARAFDHFIGKIRTVRLKLTDVNGERGGIDKHCLIELRLEPRGQIIIQRRGTSIFSASAEAIARAQTLVAKYLGKNRRRRMHNQYV